MPDFYDRLINETDADRQAFISIPLIRRTVSDGTTGPVYLAFLEQAYHHVRHTCNLLALAAARCEPADTAYQNSLYDYINEEKGHELWILDDISAMGGDAGAASAREPHPACAAMVGYMYYAIEYKSPYCLLGMIHVLEGMSALLAQEAAEAIGRSLGVSPGQAGFVYLTSHGALDIEHVDYFKGVVNAVSNPLQHRAIVESARIIYHLYGNIFRALGQSEEGHRDDA